MQVEIIVIMNGNRPTFTIRNDKSQLIYNYGTLQNGVVCPRADSR